MALTMGKPEGFLQRLVPDRFKAKDVDSKLQRWAGRLSPESREKLEEALSSESLDERLDAFAETVDELRGGEEIRPLYAATVLGLRQLSEQTDNPLVDLTAASSCDAEQFVDTAMPAYLGNLTKSAVEGLEAYQTAPDSNPFEFAAGLESKLRYTLRRTAPILLREHPQLRPHLDWFELASRTNEGYSTSWIQKLHPNMPLARAFHMVLEEQQRMIGDEAIVEVKEMVLDARDYEDNAEVQQLGQRCWDQLEGNWDVPLLLEKLDAIATGREKAAERQVERLAQALEPGVDALSYLEDGVEVGEQYLPYLFA